VTSVTDEEFDELLRHGFGREAIHLETRDAYGTAVELPHMARWAAGEHDSLEAGEDIRWVPRTLVSSVALPGNDFYLFDDRLAVFLLYTGSGMSAGMVSSDDLADLRLCRSAFESVWTLAIPHRAYQPV
jgi:hypothetical protein